MQPSVLDLFAGCGGLSLGLCQAGFDLIAACERDVWAADTYAANHADVHLLRRDILSYSDQFWKDKFGGVDVVAGGPPCQGFSVSGKRQYGVFLEHNSMVEEFVRIAVLLKPQLILMENVRGFRTALLRPGIKALGFVSSYLSNAGYHVYTSVLEASQYGVPSLRTRLFVMASLRPFPFDPFTSLQVKSTVSVADAIDDLPQIEAAEGTDGPQRYTAQPRTEFQRRMRQKSKRVYNHVAMKHSRRLVERFAAIPQGGSGYRLGHSKEGGAATIYKSNNQRLFADRPALCITANFQSNYVHPRLNRNLTAREAARLMTFPDNFIFKGKRTQMSSAFLKKYGRQHEDFLSQYNQIGNAVPPVLAAVIGRQALSVMSGKAASGRDLQLELTWSHETPAV